MNPVAKKRSLACYSRNRPVTEPLFVLEDPVIEEPYRSMTLAEIREYVFGEEDPCPGSMSSPER